MYIRVKTFNIAFQVLSFTMKIIRPFSLPGLEPILQKLLLGNALNFPRVYPLYPHHIIRVDWVGRAGIIPTSDHLVRGVIRFPHSNPDYIISFPLEIGSAGCALSSRNLRRISLNIRFNVYFPWNCEVVFFEEFALHVMYSGHGSYCQQNNGTPPTRTDPPKVTKKSESSCKSK
jgi:hypothetical protein